MKSILKVILIVGSIALGLYVGIWLMLIGCIVQIVNGVNPINGLAIALAAALND